MTSSPEPPAPSTSTGRRYGGLTPQERHADRRRRLLAAGLEAFGTTGYDGTAIDQLCVAAGVATRSFYELFASREEILITLHDEVNERAYDAVVAVLAREHDDLAQRVREALGAYLRVMTEDPRLLRIVARETVGASPATHAARDRARGRFALALQTEADRLVEAGVLAPRDRTLTAVALVGGLTALVETLTGDPDRERIAAVEAEGAELILVVLAGAPT